MPYVTPKLQSIQYTGQNMEAIQQIVNTSDYWQSATFTVTDDRIRWQGSEDDRITIPVGGYLVYNQYSNNYKGMTAEAYEASYHEIA